MNQVFTVSQINSYIRTKFETDSRLRSLSVKGELSNVKYHSSGHIYFTLKDNDGALAAVMFRGSRAGLAFQMADGQKVVVTGAVSVYERDGKYQLYASRIELAGAGELYERYERLRRELEEMGMFDESYKKSIPAYVKTLGVVTAPTGAAVRDIINVSKRRFPYIQIILYPAKVQGEGAAQSVAEGIRLLDEYGVDCIIAGRGGGSIEDLWAFNEEIVARAIFDCSTPVISAVGHETDTTIADWVADLRAPTPSAAAELAIFDYSAFVSRCFDLQSRLGHLMNKRLSHDLQLLEAYEKNLRALSPQAKLREGVQRLSGLSDRLEGAMDGKIRRCRDRHRPFSDRLGVLFDMKLKDKKHRMALLSGRLEGLSPLAKLSQGYSMLEGPEGRILSSVKGVSAGDELTVHMLDGDIRAEARAVKRIDR